MIDYLITQAIVHSITDPKRSHHSLGEVVLVFSYIVFFISAIVVAASLARRHKNVGIVNTALLSPTLFYLLLPFGVYQHTQ